MSPRAKAAEAPARRSRGSLSQEEILAGAIELVERDGLEGLSMPILARHLGAGVMSLYWYFHSKDELLAAMAEHAIREVYGRLSPPGDGPWDEEMLRLTTEFAAEARRSPLFAELCGWRPALLASRPDVLQVLASRFDQELQLLTSGLGVTAGEAAGLHNILYGPTVGFVLMQLGATGGDDEPTAAEALEEAVARLDRAEFPTLKAIDDLEALVALDDETFEDVLGLLIAGMKSEYAGTAKPATAAKAAKAAKPARSTKPRATSRSTRRSG
jgi:AcrR family transcriptional regulator